MKSKKAAIEVQFNWIFILIAGSVILLFFGTIIVKQRAASEQKIAAILLTDLESIMTGASVSEQAMNFYPIPNKEINFESCDFYYIGKKQESNTKLKKDIKETIVFTPDLIKGTRLVTWTLPWDIPYRVTNFLYLTSPQVRYIFYDTISLIDDVEKLLPPEKITVDDEEYNVMFRQKIRPSNDLNNYKVKFVILGNTEPSPTDLNIFSNMEDEDVTAIKIDGTMELGTISFYKKLGSVWDSDGSSPYLRKAALVAAIFAEDREMYECAMQNAFNRMKVVTDVYVRRTGDMVRGTCPYTAPLQHLGAILTASNQFNPTNVGTIKLRGDSLKLQDRNCPLVY